MFVGFTGAWVMHDRTPHDLIRDLMAEGDLYQLAEPLTQYLSKWTDETLSTTRTGVCASTLMYELYVSLYERGVLQEDDVFALVKWFAALDELNMPLPCVSTSTSSHFPSTEILSPPAPKRLSDTHAAVHINTDFWHVIGPWHAMFASQYRSVSFHVQLIKSSMARYSSFDNITHFMSYSRNIVNGDDSYKSLLDVLLHNENARSADIVVWQHDDLLFDMRMFQKLMTRDICIAKSGYGHLPDVGMWNASGTWWQSKSNNMNAADTILDMFSEVLRGECDTDWGHFPLSSRFSAGQSDALAIRRTCASTQR